MLLDQYGNKLKSNSSKRYTKPIMTRARLTTDRDTITPYTSFQSYKTAGDAVDWKLSFLKEEDLVRKDANTIVKILLQSSPDLSRAHSDMQMFVNTGFELSIADDGEAIPEQRKVSQEILDDSLKNMEALREPLRVKSDKFVSSLFLKGALYSECVFDGPDGEEFVEIRVLNPFRVAYRETEDERRGQYLEWGEERNGQFYTIDSPRVQYIPVNPVDDSPLGTPMIGSAIFPIVFLLGMMKSARQVIDSQAFPMGLITIDGEKMLASGANEATLADDIENLADSIEKDMTNASLNEVFVYGAEVAYQIIGAMGKNNLDALEMIQKILDQWIYRALKQFPVIFGSTEGNALSSNAEQQLEAHSIFIDSLQSMIENLLTIHFTQILRNSGSRANPVFRLRRTNALTDRIRSERFQIKVDAVTKLVINGIISQQEAKNLIRDPEAVDNISSVLEADLQPEAQRIMRGSSNAEDERVQDENEEQAEDEE